jgi:CHAT domain-containing protein
MKNLFILSIMLCSTKVFCQNVPENLNLTDTNGLRQGKWKIHFTKKWQVTTIKDSIAYYRIIEYKDDKPVGMVTDYYLNGQKQFEGQMIADRPEEIMEGIAVWYYENGNKSQETTFTEGKMIGETKKYKLNGTLETESWQQLNNHGVAFYEAGNYQEARPILEKARLLSQKEFTKLHPNYATSCGNLALLYNDQGLYDKAEPLYLEAKSINEKVLGKLHPSYATSCNNLAGLYWDQGLYAKAESLYLEDKDITERMLGKLHPHYATSCGNLAGLYRNQGLYAKAEPLYLEAKGIREKVLGKLHPDYATSCNSLAGLYRDQGLYAKAEPLYLEAKGIREKVLGKLHPDYASSCNGLAQLYNRQGLYAQAEPLRLAALQTYLFLIETQFSNLSEKEKEVFLATFNYYFEIFNSFVLHRKSQNPSIVATMYNNQLAIKALLFNTQNKIRNNILNSNSPVLLQTFESWQAKRNYLAKAYQMTLEEKQKRNIDVKQLEEEANNLEKQLSAQSETFGKAQDKKRYSWRDVQKALKPNEAAIEMVKFDWYNSKWTDTVYYAALIVTPTSKLPELVLFENGNALEKHIAFYKNHIKFQLEDNESYNQFWKPIANKLKTVSPKTTKVYFSSDGVYHSINLQTLRNPQTGKYVANEWSIQLLTNTKDLVTLKQKPNTTKAASLFGYPDYGSNSTDSTRSFNIGYPLPKTDSLKRDFTNGHISMLPGTEKEVKEIQKSLAHKNWETTTYILGHATENRLKALQNPKVLHIATHGFFMKDAEGDKRERGFARFDNQKIFENPLLRSGLLLAGSQQAFDGKVNVDEEDGILTAYEAMNLNLDNTDLVILSACETGLGEIRNGEGVFGLQRAFQTAGAKSIIMSLWKVDDESTQELMRLFYDIWLKTDNKRMAFEQAQEVMKNKYKHPYYWGAFVLVGN